MTENIKDTKTEEKGSIQFQVDASLLFQLGEQLVARRSVALAELIKNAYDADATNTTVLLEDVTRPQGTIIVEDNGTGMIFEQVRDHWMRIATDDKLRNPISSVFGRPRTGAKGIGRFAARRLAKRLVLHSVAQRDEGYKEQVDVEFDWKEFKVGQNLTDIPVSYTRKVVSDDTPTGVMLYLEDVRDVWSQEDIVELQRDLFTLVSPFPEDELRPVPIKEGYKTDPGFSFHLEVPEFPEYAGELRDQFLAAAWGVLTGYVNEQGIPQYTLEIRQPKEEVLFEPTDEVFDDLITVRFRIHYFVYRADLFDDFSFGVRDARGMGREQGGVRIYLDGFRVFPYGDPGDDWLQLDEVRAGRTRRLVDVTEKLREMERLVPGRPELLTPGNNQVFGAVVLSRLGHPKVEINVSRERLVENEAFAHLRRFVQLGIYWMTLQYARVRSEETAKKREEEKEAKRPSVPDIIGQAQAEVRVSAELSDDSRNELLRILDYAKERAQVEKEEYIDELSLLRGNRSDSISFIAVNRKCW